MNRVTIIDAIMGAGKTSWALQRINEAESNRRFIYITPFLSEVERVIKSVSSRQFIQPNNANSEGRKLRSLKGLIASGANIAATHSLFQTADDELIELLSGAGYTLILDEVMDVIEQANIKTSDIRTLLKAGHIEVNENKVRWVSDDYIDGRFDDIKQLARAGNLYMFRNKFLLWSFPPQVFKAFDDVVVMTYLFEAQIQRYYYELHEIPYQYRSIKESGGNYEMVDYDKQSDLRGDIFSLIDLYEGRLNKVGEMPNSFSATRLRNYDTETLETIKKNTYNFFRNECKARCNDILWTTLKDSQQSLKGRGYSKSFIPVNLRATNDFADRWALAYLFNRYTNPYERSFFEDAGVTVNQDLLAVSDLLQWIWRSRIRKGKPIKLYLPSSRMRRLLEAWANYEI